MLLTDERISSGMVYSIVHINEPTVDDLLWLRIRQKLRKKSRRLTEAHRRFPDPEAPSTSTMQHHGPAGLNQMRSFLRLEVQSQGTNAVSGEGSSSMADGPLLLLFSRGGERALFPAYKDTSPISGASPPSWPYLTLVISHMPHLQTLPH